jgi:hypothetical protein
MDTGTETQTTVPEPRSRGRGLLWGFIAVLLAFGAGFGWQFYEASTLRDQLSQTEQELMIERLRVRLGQAAISAQAGDYETARRQMSDYFTRLDEAQIALPDNVASVADEFLAMRDEVITGLSRSNPEFAGVLYGMLDRFTNVAGLEETMAPAQAPTEGPAGGEMPAAPGDTAAGGG